MKTQIWIAIAVYVLVAIIKKQLRLDVSLTAATDIVVDALREITTETSCCQRRAIPKQPNIS